MHDGTDLERALALNGRHRGETVFIIGAGPQLGGLGPDLIGRLADRVTIGVNLTFYVVPPRYFLSAYIGQVILARHRSPESLTLHMRRRYATPLWPGVVPLKREVFEDATDLPDRFDPPVPTLLTRKNVVLGATHLAFILGARRIVYIGVEQRNQLHFWHVRPEPLPVMREDLDILRDVPFLAIDHPHATYASAVAKLERTAEECAVPFYVESHEETFRTYFRILREAGVSIVSTARDSVVCDAGAGFVPLDEVLADGG